MVAAAGFAKALGTIIEVYIKDISQRKKWGVEFTKADPAVADKIAYAALRTKVDPRTVQNTADTMVQH